MSDTAWIEKLAVGDPVMVSGRFGSGYYAHTVERLTPSQVVVNGIRYWKKNGDMVGSDIYSGSSIHECTPERMKAAIARASIEYLGMVAWSSLQADAVIEIANAVRAAPRIAKRRNA